MPNPFTEHNGECTPAAPCSHCRGMMFLRRKLGSAQVQEMLDIFAGRLDDNGLLAEPQTLEDEITMVLRETGMAETATKQLMYYMRSHDLSGWDGLQTVCVTNPHITNFSRKAKGILKKVIDKREPRDQSKSLHA